jgi:hypothetical protein
VGLPEEALGETEQTQGRVRNRVECSSPNRKRPSACLAESKQMGATGRTNQRGEATGSCSPVEEDGGGGDEEDSKPCPMASIALIGSYPDPAQVVVQEEATTPREIPYDWTPNRTASYRLHHMHRVENQEWILLLNHRGDEERTTSLQH